MTSSGWGLPAAENPCIFAGTAGFILKNSPGSVIFNFTVGASNLSTNEIDLVNETIGDKAAYPLYNDMSLTLGFNSMRSFAVLKEVMQIYLYDGETGKVALFRNGSQAPYVQLIPVFEQWLTPSFSLRAGPVVSTDYESWGFGGVLGSTISFNKTKELDISITYRQRPSRAIRAELIPEFIISVGYSRSTRNNVFLLAKNNKKIYIYYMRNLQISLDNNIVSSIEKITKEQHKTRSAVIREAINYWIKHRTIDNFESQWISTLKKEKSEYNAANDEAWMDAEQWDES